MRTSLPLVLAAALAFLAPASARGEVRLAKVFTSAMVLQQQTPIRIWGMASPDEQVDVALTEADAAQPVARGATRADSAGRWRVDLPARKADGKRYTLTARGTNAVERKDVVLGEVWLAVGQSNMSRGLRYVKDRILKEPMDAPDLRLFFVELDQVPRPDEPAGVRGWATASHDSMRQTFVHPTIGPYEFSEVAYEFGRELHARLRTPVGMIAVAYPGSTAAQWTPAEKPADRFDFAAAKPDLGPGGMYQAMLAGVAPLAVRGVVYYQGENDAGNEQYGRDLRQMLAGWRSRFEQPKLPLLMTQLAQTTFGGGTLQVVEIQQRLTEEDPLVFLAPSNDLWDGGLLKRAISRGVARIDRETGWPLVAGGDPHPPNKHVVAGRLARLALARVYEQHQDEAAGPMVDTFKAADGKLLVVFRHAGSGLTTDDGEPPCWFEIAGEDQRFVPARARLAPPDRVELSADSVPAPRHFRFAWHTLARHNLYNREGLPAIPYRSPTRPPEGNGPPRPAAPQP